MPHDMNLDDRAVASEDLSETAIDRAEQALACTTRSPTAIGCSSLRRMRRSRPNTCCWSITSTASTMSCRPRSGSISAASRASMAAGRSITVALSTFSASVKAYFALKATRATIPLRPHMARARQGDPGGGRRRAGQCLHPHPARAVRRGAVACGAGDAGRDHGAAEAGSPSICSRSATGRAPWSCRCWCSWR